MPDLSWLPAADEQQEDQPDLSFLPPADTTRQAARNINAASGLDPDAEGRHQQLAEETGIPLDIVRRNEKEVARILESKKLERLSADNPRTMEFLQSLPAAAVSHDGIDGLTGLEKKAKSFDRTIFYRMGVPAGISSPYIEPAEKDPAKRYPITTQSLEVGAQNVRLGKLQYQKAMNVLAGKTDAMLDNRIITFKREMIPPPETEGPGQYIWSTSMEMLPLSADSILYGQTIGLQYGAFGGTAAAAMGPAAPVAVPAATGIMYGAGVRLGAAENMYRLETGLAFDEYSSLVDENGNPIDPKIAAIGAIATGAINAPLEFIGLSHIPGVNRLLGGIQRTAVSTALKNRTVRAALARVLLKYGRGVAWEAGTEAGQEAVAVINREIIKNVSNEVDETKFKATFEDFWPRVLESGLAGGSAALLISLPGSAVNGSIDVYRSGQAQQFTAAADEFFNAAEESKLKARSPDALREYFEVLGVGKDIYVSPDFFQSEKDPAVTDEIMRKLGKDPEEARRQAEDGQDVTVNFADVNARLSAEEFNAVKPDLKPAPGAMTAREVEATDYKAGFDNIADEMYQRRMVQSEIRSQISRIRKEGISAGRTPAEMKQFTDSITRNAGYFNFNDKARISYLRKINLRKSKAPTDPNMLRQQGRPKRFFQSASEPQRFYSTLVNTIKSPRFPDRATPDVMLKNIDAWTYGPMDKKTKKRKGGGFLNEVELEWSGLTDFLQYDLPAQKRAEWIEKRKESPEVKQRSYENYLSYLLGNEDVDDIDAELVAESKKIKIIATKQDVIDYLDKNNVTVEVKDIVDLRGGQMPDFWEDDDVYNRAWEHFEEDFSRGAFDIREEINEEIEKAWDDEDHIIWDRLGKRLDYLENADAGNEFAREAFFEDAKALALEDEDFKNIDDDEIDSAWDMPWDYRKIWDAINKTKGQYYEENADVEAAYDNFGGDVFANLDYDEIFDDETYYQLKNYYWDSYSDRYIESAVEAAEEEWEESGEGGTKFEGYTVKGPKTNYQEILFIWPQNLNKPYTKDVHWDDIEDFIAHARVDRRITTDNKRILFVNEVQGDWAAEIRDEGLKGNLKIFLDRELYKEFPDTAQGLKDAKAEKQRLEDTKAGLVEFETASSGMEPMPFTSNWRLVALKELVRMAAEEDMDGIAFATGKMQMDIYPNISKLVDKVVYNEDEKKIYYHEIKSTDPDRLESHSNVYPRQLKKYIGRDSAKAMFAKEPDENGARTLEGKEIVFKGYGLRAMYDEIIPAEMNKFFGKGKFGFPKMTEKGKVEITTDKGDEKVWFMPMTDKIKKIAGEEGFPLFQTDQPQKPPRGGLTVANQGYIIDMFERADRSTIWHESAHIFFAELQSMVLSKNASEQHVKDYEKIKDWLGLADEDEFTREHQETFARGFEAYLWEGKAPDAEMEGVFQRFKTWLRSVYKSIEELNVKLNDDVRDIFARMITTRDNIESTAVLWGFTMPDKFHLDKLGVVADDRAYMQRLINDAYDKAEIAMVKARDKDRRIQTKKWRAAIDREIEQSPVYTFVAALRKGEGMNREILTEEYGPDAVAALPHGIVKSGGVDPLEAIAGVFESPEDMMQALAGLPNKAQYKRQRLNELQTEHDSRYLAVDYLADTKEFGAFYEILAKYTDRDARGVTPQKAFSLYAERKMRGFTVAEAMRPDKYLSSMKKYARREAAYAANDSWELAAKANEHMRMNYEFGRQAVKQKTRINKLLKRIQSLGKSKTIDFDYLENIKFLGQRFGLPIAAPMKTGAERGKTFNDLMLVDDISGDPLRFSDFLHNETYTTDYRKLTVSQFDELVDAISFLTVQGRNLKSGMLSDKSMEIKEAAGRIVETMRDLKDKKIWRRNSVIGNLSELGRGYFAHMDSLNFIAIAMGGYEDVGPKGRRSFATRIITDRITGAQDAEFLRFKQVWGLMEPHIKQLHAATRRLEKAYGKTIRLPGATMPKLLIRGGYTGGLSADQIFAMALNMGNLGNRERLMQGYEDLTEADINEWLDVLEKEDWDAVQGIWDTIDSLFADLDATHRKLMGFPINKVEAEPVQTKFGEYRGGYYPAIYDWDLPGAAAYRAASKAERENLLSLQSSEAIRMVPSSKSGMTKERTGSGGMPIRLSTSVAPRHLRDVVHYITHAEMVRDVDRIIRRPELQEEITRHLGKRVYDMIRPALKYIARPQREYASDFDGWVEVARAHTTPFILAINANVAFKQIFSLTGGIHDMGTLNYLRGLPSLITGSPMRLLDEIKELSPYMAARMEAWDRELMQQFNLLKPEQKSILFKGRQWTLEDIRNYGFLPIRMMDMVAVLPLWHGAYQRGLRDTNNHADAVKYADGIVRNSQPSAQPIDLVAWQRIPGIARLFSMFQTFTVGKYRQRMRLHYRAWTNKKMSNAEYTKYLLMDSWIPGIALATAGLMLYGVDTDDEDFWWEVGKGALNYFLLTGLPLVEGLFSEFGGPLDTPVATGPDEFKKLIGRGINFVDDISEDTLKKLAWSIAHVTSYFFKVPVSRVVEKGVKAYQDEDRKGPIKYLVPTPKRYQNKREARRP